MIVWVLIIVVYINGGAAVTTVLDIQSAESCATAARIVRQDPNTRSAYCIPIRKVPTH